MTGRTALSSPWNSASPVYDAAWEARRRGTLRLSTSTWRIPGTQGPDMRTEAAYSITPRPARVDCEMDPGHDYVPIEPAGGSAVLLGCMHASKICVKDFASDRKEAIAVLWK